MLDLIGDILNWAAAGLFFPLLFLPLAELAAPRRATFPPMTLMIWLLIVAAVGGLSLIFIHSAPRLPLGDLAKNAALAFGLVAGLGAFLFTLKRDRSPSSQIAPTFKRIARAAGRAAMWLLIAMAIVQFAIVVSRYVFGVNSILLQESVTYMHGAVFLLAGGYAALTDDHVRVDIFYRGASPRRKALIDLAGVYLLLFPICVALVWTASPYVANSWAVGEGSTETSGIQAVYLLKSLIPAFAVLLAMAGFAIASRAAATLKRA